MIIERGLLIVKKLLPKLMRHTFSIRMIIINDDIILSKYRQTVPNFKFIIHYFSRPVSVEF